MRLADPIREQSCAVVSSPLPETDVTHRDVSTMMLYLRKARDRAIAIRERAPGGSYLESVLTRTIDGITLELSHLDYLLAQKPVNVASMPRSAGRMRPAI